MVFTCLQYKSFENTVGKGEIAHNEQFFLFPQCFLRLWRICCYFHQILNCRLQTLSVWKSLKFVVWDRVKHHLFLPVLLIMVSQRVEIPLLDNTGSTFIKETKTELRGAPATTIEWMILAYVAGR